MPASRAKPVRGPRSFGRDALEAMKAEILNEEGRAAVSLEDLAYHRANKRAAKIIDRYLSGASKEVVS